MVRLLLILFLILLFAYFLYAIVNTVKQNKENIYLIQKNVELQPKKTDINY